MAGARLLLEDGTELRGRSLGFPRSVCGEVVFNTGMADFGIPLITNIQLAQRLVESIVKKRMTELHIKSWNEYAPPERAPARAHALPSELKPAA
jgi:Carbamoyl-phosphate synthase small chain, CPSase domain